MPCDHAICPVQDCFQWWLLVKRGMKFRIHKRQDFFWMAVQQVASQKWLWYTETFSYLEIRSGQIFVLFPNCPNRLWGPPKLVIKWYRKSFHRWQRGRMENKNMYLWAFPLLRMNIDVPVPALCLNDIQRIRFNLTILKVEFMQFPTSKWSIFTSIFIVVVLGKVK
jgi:hypothetical protein